MSQVSRPMQILLLATVALAAVWFVALRPKPSGDGGGGSAPAASAQSAAPTAPGVKGLTTAIAKAHGAVATANGAAQQAVGSSASGAAHASPTPSAAAPGEHTASVAAPAKHATTSGHTTASRHTATTHHGAATHHATTAHARRVARVRRHRAAVHRHAIRRRAAHAARRVRLVDAALRHHEAVAIAFVDPSAADSRAVVVEMAHVGGFGRHRALTVSIPLAELSRYGAITREVQVTVAPTVVIVAPNGSASTITGFADRVEIRQRIADALTQRHT